jgi:hypothetical protein
MTGPSVFVESASNLSEADSAPPDAWAEHITHYVTDTTHYVTSTAHYVLKIAHYVLGVEFDEKL